MGQFSVFIEKFFLAGITFSAFVFVFHFLSTTVSKLKRFKKLQQELLSLISQILKLTGIVLGIISAMGTLGIDISAAITGLGLTGFALGFAFKDVLANILSGIMILLYHPFRLNNYIIVDEDKEGQVIEINLRYTILKKSKSKILIPNSMLLTEVVIVKQNSESQES